MKLRQIVVAVGESSAISWLTWILSSLLLVGLNCAWNHSPYPARGLTHALGAIFMGSAGIVPLLLLVHSALPNERHSPVTKNSPDFFRVAGWCISDINLSTNGFHPILWPLGSFRILGHTTKRSTRFAPRWRRWGLNSIIGAQTGECLPLCSRVIIRERVYDEWKMRSGGA